MRSRTEMVTTTLEGSDFEEESDLEDSGEDWKPAAKKKVRSLTKNVRSSKKRKPVAKKRGRQPAAKKSRGRKKDSSTEEEDDVSEEESLHDSSSEEDDEPIRKSVVNPPPRSKPAPVIIKKDDLKKKPTVPIPVPEKSSPNVENGSGKAKPPQKSENLSVLKPLQRKTSTVKNFPDRNGQFELLVCKSVLKDGIKENPNICLWRRDGSSLLQKYVPDDDANAVEIFKSSSVYSCWEEKKSKNYYEVKVQCHGDSQSGKIKILNLDELEKIAETLETDDEDVEDEPDVKNETGDGKAGGGGRHDDVDEDEEDEDDDEEEE